MLNPVRNGFYAIQLLSHKVMRYLVPFFLIAILIASVGLVLTSTWVVYPGALIAQLAFYLGAFSAWLLERAGARSPLLALPQYFVLANLASLVACYKFMRGERYARWEPIREQVTSCAPANGISPDGSRV
jgi:hypothetical protein